MADLLSLDRSKVIGGALVALSVVLALLPERLTAPARAWLQGPMVHASSTLRSGAHYLATPPGDDPHDTGLAEAYRQRELILLNHIAALRQKIDALEGAARGPLAPYGLSAQADIVMTQRARLGMAPSSLWGAGLLLDRGARAGLSPDDTVVLERIPQSAGIARFEDLAGYTLLGKLWSVGPLSSQLRLSTHERFAASVKILDDDGRDVSYGMAHGTGHGSLSVRYVKIDHTVRVGHWVVTDGRDGLFPPGLIAGRVISVTGQTVDGFLDVEAAPPYEPQEVQWAMVVRRRKVEAPE